MRVVSLQASARIAQFVTFFMLRQLFVCNEAPVLLSCDDARYPPHAHVSVPPKPKPLISYSSSRCKKTQLPFNAAELWSLHQFYFSPAPQDPHSIPTTAEGPSATAAPFTPASSATTGARGVTSNVGGRLDAGIAKGSPRGNTHSRNASGGGGGGYSDGFSALVGVNCAVPNVSQGDVTPGAGGRRSRRSSSLGGETDGDDPDSPLPPSKRYRNGSSTKTRIACFPLVQVRRIFGFVSISLLLLSGFPLSCSVFWCSCVDRHGHVPVDHHTPRIATVVLFVYRFSSHLRFRAPCNILPRAVHHVATPPPPKYLQQGMVCNG